MPPSIGWHGPHVDWMRNCASNGQRSLRDYPGWNAIFGIRGLRRAGSAAAGHRFLVPALDSARAVLGARAKDAATAMIEPPACAADRRLHHGLGASASGAVARRHPGGTPPGGPPAVPAAQPQRRASTGTSVLRGCHRGIRQPTCGKSCPWSDSMERISHHNPRHAHSAAHQHPSCRSRCASIPALCATPCAQPIRDRRARHAVGRPMPTPWCHGLQPVRAVATVRASSDRCSAAAACMFASVPAIIGDMHSTVADCQYRRHRQPPATGNLLAPRRRQIVCGGRR